MAHAAGDSHEYPVYGYHFRVVFPLLDEDGDLVSGGGSDTPDSEVSLDAGTFSDCTNELTEIATSSGLYYLDLTGAEMTSKVVAVIAKVATSTTQTTPIVLYPRRLPVLETGTAQAGAAGTITLASGASAEDDFYNGLFVGITNDTPSGVDNQLRRIVDYNGSTKVATVDSNWGTNPSSSSTYELLIPEGYSTTSWGGVKVGTATNRGLTALPNSAADAAGGLTISDAGGLDLDAKLANTNEVTAARMGALTDWIDAGRLDAILDAIAADVVNIDGTAMRGTDSAALASVCTESRLAELDAANIPADVDAILVDTGTTLDGKIDTIDTVVDAVKIQTDKLLFDASNFVKTAVNDIVIAALAKYVTVDSGETTAVAGSVAKIAQGAAGGSVDVATFSGAASTTVNAIKAKTDTIGSGTVTVTSPVALDQNVTLVKGDDYKAADGRALDFTNAAGTWPDLTGATINFKAAYPLQPTNSFTESTGSVVVASGPNQQVRIEIDGTDTTGLPAGSYEYDVEATLSSGNTVTLVSSEGNQDVELTLLESHAP